MPCSPCTPPVPSQSQHLTLDDVDLPNQRLTLAGHPQRLGDRTDRTLRTWLDHRRATGPLPPNRHVLISKTTALDVQPVSKGCFTWHLRDRGIQPERIRGDRILHEALAVGPDPLHLSLVFNLSHSAATRCTNIATALLDDPDHHTGDWYNMSVTVQDPRSQPDRLRDLQERHHSTNPNQSPA